MPSRVGGKVASLGVPGTALCRIDPPARGAPCTMPYRAPPGRAMRSSVPATKQAAGAPSAGSQPFQFTTYATTPMGRRWAAVTPERPGGPRRPGPGEPGTVVQREGQRQGTACGYVPRSSQDTRCRSTARYGRRRDGSHIWGHRAAPKAEPEVPGTRKTRPACREADTRHAGASQRIGLSDTRCVPLRD